ncbi:hypothetical protein P4O66_015347, partial [Electrophorus voltai]
MFRGHNFRNGLDTGNGTSGIHYAGNRNKTGGISSTPENVCTSTAQLHHYTAIPLHHYHFTTITTTLHYHTTPPVLQHNYATSPALYECDCISLLCDWISNFLTDRPQSVRVGNCVSSTLTLSTGVPQGCVLSPLLYSLYTYDCTATSSSTIIVKFADDTVVMGLMSDNDKRAYLEEIKHLENWCQENNLLLNVSETKELIVDCSKKLQ